MIKCIDTFVDELNAPIKTQRDENSWEEEKSRRISCLMLRKIRFFANGVEKLSPVKHFSQRNLLQSLSVIILYFIN